MYAWQIERGYSINFTHLYTNAKRILVVANGEVIMWNNLLMELGFGDEYVL